MNAEEFYSPPDMAGCAEHRGAACGHGALAAAVRCPVVLICDLYFSERLEKGEAWIGMLQMEAAMVKGRVKFAVLGRGIWPKENGLMILQWEGPWPPRAQCCFRHWVAVREGYVWDSNLECWKSREEWEAFLQDLMPKRATGWHVARGYEVKAVNP